MTTTTGNDLQAWPKKCTKCGELYSRAEWYSLTAKGTVNYGDGEGLDHRDCEVSGCGNTMCVAVAMRIGAEIKLERVGYRGEAVLKPEPRLLWLEHELEIGSNEWRKVPPELVPERAKSMLWEAIERAAKLR